MLEYLGVKVEGLSNTWDIVSESGGSPLLGIIPLDFQASAYPGSLNSGYYGQGSQPAGGKFFDDLDCDEPITIVDHTAARAQARKADIQSIEARKALNRNASYTVGRGLYVKSTPDPETTGLTPDQANELGKKITTLFHLWAKSKNSDATGDNTFYQNQRFAQRLKKRDGEAIPYFKYSDDPELINPLQITFIDPNQIRGDEFTISSGPDSDDVGINYDKNGKRKSFKIWVTDPEKPGRFKDVTIPAKDEATGRPVMMLMFDKKNPGQKRGITELLPAISDLEKITGYKTATLDRIQTAAGYTFSIENEQQTPSNMDLSAVNSKDAGTEYTTKAACAVAESPAQPWAYHSIGNTYNTGQKSTSILIDGGRKGDKLKPVNDLAPGETSKDFIGFSSDSINASLNMASEIVDMKINTSFTAAKGAFGLQDIEAGIERDDLDADLINEAFFAVISGFVGSGHIKLPGWSDPIMRAGYLEKRLTHDPPIILRPGEESVATLNNIVLGRETFEDAAERLNNSKFESNAIANQKAIKLLFSQVGTPIVEPESDDIKQDEDEGATDTKGEN